MEVLSEFKKTAGSFCETSSTGQEFLISFGGIYRIAFYDKQQQAFAIKNKAGLYLRVEELESAEILEYPFVFESLSPTPSFKTNFDH